VIGYVNLAKYAGAVCFQCKAASGLPLIMRSTH